MAVMDGVSNKCVVFNAYKPVKFEKNRYNEYKK